jgi:hypothetical protein
MKKTIPILLLALCLSYTAAGDTKSEPESLVDLRAKELGGYGGPHFKATTLNGQFTLYGGGPIMFIFKPSWALGLSISTPDGDAAGLDLYYGGLRGEYILFPGSFLSLFLGCTAGGGVARYNDHELSDDSSQTAGIVSLEPDALLSLRILPTLRIGIGGGYRLILPLKKIDGLGRPEMSGPFALVQLQYGIFPSTKRSEG